MFYRCSIEIYRLQNINTINQNINNYLPEILKIEDWLIV